MILVQCELHVCAFVFFQYFSEKLEQRPDPYSTRILSFVSILATINARYSAKSKPRVFVTTSSNFDRFSHFSGSKFAVN